MFMRESEHCTSAIYFVPKSSGELYIRARLFQFRNADARHFKCNYFKYKYFKRILQIAGGAARRHLGGWVRGARDARVGAVARLAPS